MKMFQNLLQLLKINREKMTILIVGLNNSGKSSIIQHFKRRNHEQRQKKFAVPTIAFNIEQFYHQNVFITAIDMSGAVKYRNLWQHQFKNCQGIIFVIDSGDKMRLVVVKDELKILLQHSDLINRNIPILFYNNKSDCKEFLSNVNIASALDLALLNDRPWHICSSNALTGDGLENGVQWLIQQIRLMKQIHHKNKTKKRKELN